MSDKKLYLCRSLPGAGKSTMVQRMSKHLLPQHVVRVHSTDSQHVEYIDGLPKYVFKPDKIGYFHQVNLGNTIYDMNLGTPYIFVDNTNLTFKEMRPYIVVGLALGYEIEFIEPRTPWKYNVEECFKRNTHGVPLKTIEDMSKRFQSTALCYEKLELLKKFLSALGGDIESATKLIEGEE